MSIPYVDCQGLAGAWTLGSVQAGFELKHRASLGAFGDEVVAGNIHLLGDTWTQDDGNSSDEWTPMRGIAYLNGTPPCSGFSLLNNSGAAARKRGVEAPNARGKDSAINNCMKELVRYAGKCTGTDGRNGPEIVSFESVQGAYSQGRELMQELRAMLEVMTGEEYGLTHVKMSGSSIGAAQMRHRYFPVFHRIPFGVEHPEPRKVVTYRDAIGNLIGLNLQWKKQRVHRIPSDWLIEEGIQKHPRLFVDGEMTGKTAEDPPYVLAHISSFTPEHRVHPLITDSPEGIWDLWNPGEALSDPVRRFVEKYGVLPEGIREKSWDWEANMMKGFNHAVKIPADKPGYVLTGGGLGAFLHYDEPRFLTVLEGSRLMGYPDAWDWSMARNVGQASMWIGKCCPVQSGRWIAEWVRRAVEGNPGPAADTIGNREYLFDCTNDYRKWPYEVSQYTPKKVKATA